MLSWPHPAVPELPGQGTPLRLWDTADQELRPLAPGPVATMYVCGITPYDSTHLGHAATYVTFDLIYRNLLDRGHQVHYVQNITDVDDPLFERAQRDGVDWRELGQSQIDLFRSDMATLGVIPPRDYIGAMESIAEVIAFVERLFAVGAAYRVPVPAAEAVHPDAADIYFAVASAPDFGYESNYDESTMLRFFAERGGDPERAGKRHPLDALLWRAERAGEPAWESPFGRGRPGWHIECSAIALNRLGTTFDIQGGGSDLIFPHHEFSAAHAEVATNSDRFARHYVHAGMIGLDGVKMSKSLGNLVFVSHLTRDGVPAGAIRLGLYEQHYRTDRSWSGATLERASTRFARWSRVAQADSAPPTAELYSQVRRSLSDDLNTPLALAQIDAWVDLALAEGGAAAGVASAAAPGEFAALTLALLGVDLTGAA